MEPVFLNLSEIIEIQQDQIKRYGGDSGIRDLGILKSAIATPAATFDGQFLHTDIYEMAAAYLYHIVKNHPFIDGNKRVGTVATIIFLIMNDYEFGASEDELAELVIDVASGKADKTDTTLFIRNHTKS